jgi:tetratricopeptide (TPR) repeat protein
VEVIKQNISNAKSYIKIGNYNNAVNCLNTILSIQPNNIYAKKTIKKIEKKHDIKKIFSSSPPELINELTSLYSAKKYKTFGILLNANIKKYKDCPYLNHLKGMFYKITKNDLDAISYFNKAIKLNPLYWEAYNNLGNLYFDIKKYEDALYNYNKTLVINPNFSGALCNRSITFMELNDYKSALIDINNAIQVDPKSSMAWYNKGNIFIQTNEFEQSIPCYKKAISINPNYMEAYTNLSSAYEELGFFDEGIKYIDKAIDINSSNYLAHYNKAVLMNRIGYLFEAIKSYDNALSINDTDAEVKWNKANCNLLLGDYKNGWDNFESRLYKSDWVSRDFNSKELCSRLEIKGSRILLYSEQGLGDTIQFARYAKTFVDLGAKVILEVQRPLVGLIKSFHGLTIIGKGDLLPNFDYHLPLMSCGKILETNTKNIPQVTLINNDEELTKEWGKRLGDKSFKIGVAWEGSKTHADDNKVKKLKRSFPIEILIEQLDIPNVRLISLQRENVFKDENLKSSIEILDNDFDKKEYAFKDSVAVIKNLDLVISCDTSIAHLAGSLNVPNWIALKYVPDWRWLLGREDSPWYPNTKLFRQPEWGDWEYVFKQMRIKIIKELI